VPISADHVAMAQERSTGMTLNGNGKFSWTPANQFSPLSFSSPDSQNSQPMIARIAKVGNTSPAARS